ncbi:unnamed protein product [Macrosiphum euphorbiae]|uniref:Uncharacterized protein n=1 Tax=Macrosiphum euphorbiae TaxID=13131 RepID=A0AAV0W2G1_9HEMI|nr:unnamed protein product [Macrosiphum euphorbiae]
MQSTETNTEKPDCCKLRRLKTRVSVLESDVMKNSIDIVGINHMLMLMLPSSGAAAKNDVSAGENLFELDTLNAQCHKPTSPTTSASFTLVAGPPPAETSENFWPPPPPPEVTSENFWPPPPPPAVTSENFWPPPPSFAVTSEHFWLPPPPPAVTSVNFWPPPPFHAVTSEHFWLPPPPPAVTSENFWLPAPPPPMTTGTAAFRRYLAVQKILIR